VRGNDALILSSSSMVVAITGADGFIGGNLARHFEAEGWTARRIVRPDFEHGNLDRLVAGANVVVHAAGATRASTRAALIASNVTLSERVASAAKRGGARRFVFISSQAAAGPATSPNTPVSEDTPPFPIDAYGQSKLDAERVVQRAFGESLVIVRPAAVYGPHDRDFLAMFRLSRHGLAVHAANREQWISIVHVDDLSRGVVLASTMSDAIGRTFFMANEQPVQWRDLFRLAAEAAGKTLRADVEVPRWLVRTGAAAGDLMTRLTGKAGLLTSGKVALTAPRYWICSSARIREELGFAATIPLAQGILDTYRWYRTHGWL
jgi:nucleoside-diphosphate-sugar epimerase